MPRIQTSVRLKPGTMFFFRYNNPATKVHVWDKAPLVMPLWVSSKHMLAVNLHFIPRRYQRSFINAVLGSVEKAGKRGSIKKAPRIFYDALKTSGALGVGLVAIRKYIISRITNIQEVPPEFWKAVDPSSGRYQAKMAQRN